MARANTQRFVSGDIYTRSYRIVGQILVGGMGLIGLLNDPVTSFMELHDVSLAHMHMPKKLVDEFDLLRVTKDQVVAICLKRPEDIGPKALVRGGFERITEFPIQVVTQVYEIEGTMEWSGRFDFSVIMVEGTREFIPLYNAHLKAVLIPKMRIETDAMLFNRRHVDALAQLQHRAKKE